MDVLLWLVPAAVVTLLAMLWVAWLGRESRGEVDREVALGRLGRALAKDRPLRYAAPTQPRERSTGIAVRMSSTAPRERH